MRGAVAAAAVVAILLTGCSSPKKVPPIAVHGTVAIQDVEGFVPVDTSMSDVDAAAAQAPCMTTSGYTDIAEGAQVVISDDKGATLTIVPLSAGRFTTFGYCQFTFTASVKAGKGFYGVQVTHRGVVKESEAEIAKPALSLGG